MDIVSPKNPHIKLCKKCGKHPQLGKGYSFPSWCRECHNEYKRDHARKSYSTEKGRTKFLQKNYGITQEEYNQMLLRQCGVCACCGEPEIALDPRTGKVFALSVDHNHETGRIRSLLCRECNLTVGRIENNIRIRNAFAYLQRHDNLDHTVCWPHRK